MGAPLYGVLMRAMADDWDSHGVVREICAGWEDSAPADVVQLRFLGSMHRLVLTGQADSLVPYYRNLGGSRPPEDAWKYAADVVSEYRETIRADLAVAPQTNEIGRCSALVLALYHAAAAAGSSRLRLLEVGASAGLNLLVDSYRVVFGDDAAWGPPDAPVRITPEVDGRVEATLVNIVDRRGCDPDPIDPTTSDGRLRLRSFVWPDHVDRFRRLDGALEAAHKHPAPVDRAGASSWLREQLAEQAGDDVVTVVWHSVVWQYLKPDERSEVEAVLAAGSRRHRLVHVAMEPADPRYAVPIRLTATTYDAGDPRTVLLADVHPHGTSVRIR